MTWYSLRPKKVILPPIKEMAKLKISLLGEVSVGKSCIAEKYTTGGFEKQYSPTIAVDYKNKIIPFRDTNANVR